MNDRKRLDAIKLNISRPAEVEYQSLETGQEDHAMPLKDWLDKKEPVEAIQAKKDCMTAMDRTIKFAMTREESTINEMNIHTATLGHDTSITATEEGRSTFGLNDAVARGKGTKSRKDYVLADAIRQIQTMQFVDTREEFYKKFDSLFSYVRPKQCR